MNTGTRITTISTNTSSPPDTSIRTSTATAPSTPTRTSTKRNTSASTSTRMSRAKGSGSMGPRLADDPAAYEAYRACLLDTFGRDYLDHLDRWLEADGVDKRTAV